MANTYTSLNCHLPTFRFNEPIKRNKNRFPADFMFQLRQAEFEALKSQTAISQTEGTPTSSQIAMSSRTHRGRSYRPYAFMCITPVYIASAATKLSALADCERNPAIYRRVSVENERLVA
jgi:hypothetical protein